MRSILVLVALLAASTELQAESRTEVRENPDVIVAQRVGIFFELQANPGDLVEILALDTPHALFAAAVGREDVRYKILRSARNPEDVDVVVKLSAVESGDGSIQFRATSTIVRNLRQSETQAPSIDVSQTYAADADLFEASADFAQKVNAAALQAFPPLPQLETIVVETEVQEVVEIVERVEEESLVTVEGAALASRALERKGLENERLVVLGAQLATMTSPSATWYEETAGTPSHAPLFLSQFATKDQLIELYNANQIPRSRAMGAMGFNAFGGLFPGLAIGHLMVKNKLKYGVHTGISGAAHLLAWPGLIIAIRSNKFSRVGGVIGGSLMVISGIITQTVAWISAMVGAAKYGALRNRAVGAALGLDPAGTKIVPVLQFQLEPAPSEVAQVHGYGRRFNAGLALRF